MAENIGVLMVGSGLLEKEALERAVSRKEQNGGSLALNLVMEGAVDEARLAEFYVKRFKLQPAPDAMLEGIDEATFSLIPLEIVYDSGILPIYLKDEETLVVGLCDPTDYGLIAEATFFSGYKLHQRLITVSQMARHFARLARQPWKLSVADVQALGQSPVVTPDVAKQVDALLQQTTEMEVHLEGALAASLDEVYHEDEAYLDTGPVVVDGVVEDLVSATQERVKILLPRDAVDSVSKVVMEARPRPEPEPEPMREPVKAKLKTVPAASPKPANPFAKRSITDKMIALGLAKPKQKTRRVVEGEVSTKTGPVRVLGITLEKTEPDRQIIDPVAVVTPAVSQFRSRPKTAVPARPSHAPLDHAYQKNFRLLTRLQDTFGEADDGVALAIEAISDELTKATERDALGQATVDGFGEEYERAVIFTLNGPRAVVWRCKTRGLEAKNVIGKAIAIRQGALLHRIAEERVFYFGPLPRGSKLASVLGIEHSNDLLIAPIELRGKTILILLLDAGDKPFPSPGGYIERLLVDISKGLERVILMRKRGRRSSTT